MSATSGFTVALVLLGIIVAILWIFMPFAIFGIKAKLDEAIHELRSIRELLDKQARHRE